MRLIDSRAQAGTQLLEGADILQTAHAEAKFKFKSSAAFYAFLAGRIERGREGGREGEIETHPMLRIDSRPPCVARRLLVGPGSLRPWERRGAIKNTATNRIAGIMCQEIMLAQHRYPPPEAS